MVIKIFDSDVPGSTIIQLRKCGYYLLLSSQIYYSTKLRKWHRSCFPSFAGAVQHELIWIHQFKSEYPIPIANEIILKLLRLVNFGLSGPASELWQIKSASSEQLSLLRVATCLNSEAKRIKQHHCEWSNKTFHLPQQSHSAQWLSNTTWRCCNMWCCNIIKLTPGAPYWHTISQIWEASSNSLRELFPLIQVYKPACTSRVPRLSFKSRALRVREICNGSDGRWGIIEVETSAAVGSRGRWRLFQVEASIQGSHGRWWLLQVATSFKASMKQVNWWEDN